MKSALGAYLLALISVSAFAQAPPPEPGAETSVVYTWLAPGTPLYALHGPRTEPVATVASLAFVPVFKREERWMEVMYLGERLRASLPRPIRSSYEFRPKASVSPAEAALAGKFFPGIKPRQIGPFWLVTDHPEGELLMLLESAAFAVEEAYTGRFGLSTEMRTGETFLVFSSDEAYKAFTASKPGLAIFDASTIAGQGTAALVVGERSSWEVISSFLHTATHLLNRRLFDRPMPPWLEEGMAEDLDCFWAEDPFAPAPGMMGARWNQGPVPVVGCYTPMIRVTQGGAPPELLAPELLPKLDRRAYVDAASFAKNQLSSAWLVSYLLEGENGALADGFREFLAEVAQGNPATGERLLAKLGKSWSEIEAGYRAFGTAKLDHYAALFTSSERWRAAFSGTGVRFGPEEIDIAELTRRAMAMRGTAGASQKPYKEYSFEWFQPGAEVFENTDGPATSRLSSFAYLPVLEEKGEWRQVQHLGETRWLKKTNLEPPTQKLVWKTPRPEREELGLALRLFGQKEPVGTLGPFKLHTDVTDTALLAALSEAASHLESAYERRFGLEIRSKATEVVLLFAKQDDFRSLAGSRPNLPISDPAGFAGQGTAILFAGERSRWDVLETLIHELTHVLNRRRLNNPYQPPWLEEGLATDLGCLWTEDPNALVPGMVKMEGKEGEWYSVGSACAARLFQFKDQTQVQKLPTVEQLVSASREQFYLGAAIGYTAAELLVSYFLDGEEGALASGFKAFLSDVAREREATPKLLQKHLGKSWEELDTGFRLYVAEEAKRVAELMTYKDN